MAEHIKAIPPPETGMLLFETNQEGADMFERLIDRAEPRRNDDKGNFNRIRDRVKGAFFAGKVQMGWGRK